MDTKVGTCGCAKRNVVLRKVGKGYKCVECIEKLKSAKETDPEVVEQAEQVVEEEDGKDTLLD
ncbi:MAG: hypothetical protein ACXABY_01680 [Candidatus Thorarchaeota archaeon]|jgi:hypothetical protein